MVWVGVGVAVGVAVWVAVGVGVRGRGRGRGRGRLRHRRLTACKSLPYLLYRVLPETISTSSLTLARGAARRGATLTPYAYPYPYPCPWYRQVAKLQIIGVIASP